MSTSSAPSVHDYTLALEELRAVLSTDNLAGAATCAQKLRAALPEQIHLERNRVLVAYGGGKDSSYTLAFVRTMQLVLFQIFGTTFHMRVVTNRHAGMPRAVMENMDRAYRALGLLDDPSCELLVVDGNVVAPFDVDMPQRPEVVARNRTDILMTGHRTAGDARPTFCNACNLSMVNAFGLAAGHDGGVDVIITGDSRREQRDYYLWVNRLAGKFGLRPKDRQRPGFKGFLSSLNNIATAYFTDIHGPDAAETVDEHRVATEVREDLRFFSIYDDTAYASGAHWDLLTRHLGFVFDDIAFSFTESDCGNPALMAHLRAIKTEHRFGGDYASGLEEYVEFALSLMRDKEFPQHLIDTMRERYSGPGVHERMRRAMDAYARDTYGLSPRQLVTMVWAPFTEKGANLEQFLAAEHPELAADAERIHRLLDGGDDDELTATVAELSGLSLSQLRVLYRSALRPPSVTPADGQLIDAILAGDPHKKVITTRHDPQGPPVTELLSGR